MYNIVLDTNALVKGLLGNQGECRTIINLAIEGELTIWGSSHTRSELINTLKKPRLAKYITNRYYSLEKIIHEYDTLIQFYEPDGEISDLSRDRDDNIFIALAKMCKCKILISDDNDLLVLDKSIDKLRIITPTNFVAAINKQLKRT